MKMTLLEVLNRQRTLSEFVSKKLPYKLAYAISKNLAKLQAEAEIIDKGRIALVEEYAVKDEDGKPVVKDNNYDLGENAATFSAEFNKYMSTETDVDIYTVPESVLGTDDPRFDVLTVAQIVALDFMIE